MKNNQNLREQVKQALEQKDVEKYVRFISNYLGIPKYLIQQTSNTSWITVINNNKKIKINLDTTNNLSFEMVETTPLTSMSKTFVIDNDKIIENTTCEKTGV